MANAFFLQHFAGDPFFNMAVDEWLLRQVSSHPGLIYLRLYTWKNGAITFGINQRKELALDFSRISSTPVIRRITGGRAIYHDPGELTYSIAVNTHHLGNLKLVGSLTKTTQSIAAALMCFLGRLGIKSHYLHSSSLKDSEPAFFHTAACFDSISRYELVANYQKIIASAQRRVGAAYLQHGSIKLHGVASHPALATKLLPGSSGTDVPPISREEFDLMTGLFGQEMGLYFELELKESYLIPPDQYPKQYEVKNRISFLKKNPLSRRDIIKHWSSANSLYIRG